MKNPPCHRCNAACCKQEHTGYEYAVYLEDTDDVRLQEKAIIFPHSRLKPLFVLPYKEDTGSCVYLDDETNTCTVYDYRPQVCRNFNCTLGYGVGLEAFKNDFLVRNPQVVKIIKLETAEQVRKRREEFQKQNEL